MNKTIATAAIAGSIILSPVAAMSVTPVRDALLGLAPEEQIVTLADEIDKSRVENEQKLATLEQELASTKQKNAELEEALENQVLSSEAKAKQIADNAVAAAKQSQENEACLARKASLQKGLEAADEAYDDCIKGVKNGDYNDEAKKSLKNSCENDYASRKKKINSWLAELSC
jgi:TolA-binding protein